MIDANVTMTGMRCADYIRLGLNVSFP